MESYYKLVIKFINRYFPEYNESGQVYKSEEFHSSTKNNSLKYKLKNSIKRFPVLKGYLSNLLATRLETYSYYQTKPDIHRLVKYLPEIVSLCLDDNDINDGICDEIIGGILALSPSILYELILSGNLSISSLLNILCGLIFDPSEGKKSHLLDSNWVDTLLLNLKKNFNMKIKVNEEMKLSNEMMEQKIKSIENVISNYKNQKIQAIASSTGIAILEDILNDIKNMYNINVHLKLGFISLNDVIKYLKSCKHIEYDKLMEIISDQYFKCKTNEGKQFFETYKKIIMDSGYNTFNAINILSYFYTITYYDKQSESIKLLGNQFLVYLTQKSNINFKEMIWAIYTLDYIRSACENNLSSSSYQNLCKMVGGYIESIWFENLLDMYIYLIKCSIKYDKNSLLNNMPHEKDIALDFYKEVISSVCHFLTVSYDNETFSNIENQKIYISKFEDIFNLMEKKFNNDQYYIDLFHSISQVIKDNDQLYCNHFFKLFWYKKVMNILSGGCTYSKEKADTIFNENLFLSIFDFIGHELSNKALLETLPTIIFKLKFSPLMAMSLSEYTSKEMTWIYHAITQFENRFKYEALSMLLTSFVFTQSDQSITLNNESLVHIAFDLASFISFKRKNNIKSSWNYSSWFREILDTSIDTITFIRSRLPYESLLTLKNIQIALHTDKSSSELEDLKNDVNIIISQKSNITRSTNSINISDISLYTYYSRCLFLNLMESFVNQKYNLSNIIKHVSSKSKDLWIYFINDINTKNIDAMWISIGESFQKRFNLFLRSSNDTKVIGIFKRYYAIIVNTINLIIPRCIQLQCFEEVPNEFNQFLSQECELSYIERILDIYLNESEKIPNLIALWNDIFESLRSGNTVMMKAFSALCPKLYDWVLPSLLEKEVSQILVEYKIYPSIGKTYIEQQTLDIYLYLLAKLLVCKKEELINLNEVFNQNIISELYLYSNDVVDMPPTILQLIYYLYQNGYISQILNNEYIYSRLTWLVNRSLPEWVSPGVVNCWKEFLNNSELKNKALILYEKRCNESTIFDKELKSSIWNPYYDECTIKIDSNLLIPFGIWLDWELKALYDGMISNNYMFESIPYLLNNFLQPHSDDGYAILKIKAIFTSICRYFFYYGHDSTSQFKISDIITAFHMIYQQYENIMGTWCLDLLLSLPENLENSKLVTSISLTIYVLGKENGNQLVNYKQFNEEYFDKLKLFIKRSYIINNSCMMNTIAREIIFALRYFDQNHKPRFFDIMKGFTGELMDTPLKYALNESLKNGFIHCISKSMSRDLVSVIEGIIQDSFMDTIEEDNISDVDMVKIESLFELYDTIGIDTPIKIINEKRSRSI